MNCLEFYTSFATSHWGAFKAEITPILHENEEEPDPGNAGVGIEYLKTEYLPHVLQQSAL